MDPNALLAELRLLVEALRPALHGAPAIPGVDVPPAERLQSALDTAGDLADRLEALDASLSAGGRLPCAWARVPEEMTDEEARARLALWGIG